MLGLIVAGDQASQRRGSGAPPPSHPADRMGVREAFIVGIRLGQQGRHLEAVPYYRRVIAETPDAPHGHLNYSTALGNSAFEVRLHLGKAEPAMRSSYDRIRATHASLAELDRTEQLVSVDHDRSFLEIERGRALEAWGMPIDALAEYRRAQSVDPAQTQAPDHIRRLESLLRTGGGPTE